MDGETPFLPLHRVAIRLGLPVAWLRSEVDAGRVPCLKANRRIFLNPDTVEQVLMDRAKHDTTGAREVAHA